MSVNRDNWKPRFATFPGWLCPTCQDGSLSLKTDTFHFIETGASKRAHSHEAWEPEWIEEQFAGLLVCQNGACGEVVAIGGYTHHEEDHDWEAQEQNWEREFSPKFLYPAPPIFPIAKGCPTCVAEELRRAFSLFWSDSAACANRLRAAAEALLTEKKVTRTTVNRNARRVPLSLHDRIERFKAMDERSADYLLAIKWIGNVGSHANLNALSRDDLLDGFELFEHVVERVFVRREEKLIKLARGINARKGRPAKRRTA